MATNKTKILFVCLGNICRSPMAEFVMKKLVAEACLSERFEISSAATSSEERGNPVYPPARRMLEKNGIECSLKKSRKITIEDVDYYDYIVVMDDNNLRNLQRMFGKKVEGKLSLLLDYTDTPRNVADPWYTGDFETTWEDVNKGCKGLFERITNR